MSYASTSATLDGESDHRIRTQTAPLTVPCCDICDPTLLDRTRPPPITADKRATPIKRGLPDLTAQRSLRDWRQTVFVRDHSYAQYDASAILNNDLIASPIVCGPLDSSQLSALLKDKWSFWDKYHGELGAFVSTISITFTPIPSKPRAPRRLPPSGAPADDPAASIAAIPEAAPLPQLPPFSSSSDLYAAPSYLLASYSAHLTPHSVPSNAYSMYAGPFPDGPHPHPTPSVPVTPARKRSHAAAYYTSGPESAYHEGDINHAPKRPRLQTAEQTVSSNSPADIRVGSIPTYHGLHDDGAGVRFAPHLTDPFAMVSTPPYRLPRASTPRAPARAPNGHVHEAATMSAPPFRSPFWQGHPGLTHLRPDTQPFPPPSPSPAHYSQTYRVPSKPVPTHAEPLRALHQPYYDQTHSAPSPISHSHATHAHPAAARPSMSLYPPPGYPAPSAHLPITQTPRIDSSCMQARPGSARGHREQPPMATFNDASASWAGSMEAAPYSTAYYPPSHATSSTSHTPSGYTGHPTPSPVPHSGWVQPPPPSSSSHDSSYYQSCNPMY